MVDADGEKFREMVQVLALNFNKQLTPQLIELLFSGMRSIPMSAVKLGFRRALETCKFFPTVAELRDLTREAVAEAKATAQWDPAKALGAVEWDERKPEVGGFKRYLKELAARKAVRGGAYDATMPDPVAVVREPVLQAPAGGADGDGDARGDRLRGAGGERDVAPHPARREQVPGGGG